MCIQQKDEEKSRTIKELEAITVKKKKKVVPYAKRVKNLEKKLDIAWSKSVRERDGKCLKCGKEGFLSAHHAFGRRHKSTRWDLMNGVSLCSMPCHLFWAHRDPCSFAEWFKAHVGNDQYNRLAEAHRNIAKFTEEELMSILEGLK